MSYHIILLPNAKRHLEEWKKFGQPKVLHKILRLFEELQEHPTSGTGKPERLSGDLSGYWSRRVNKSARMIYKIEEDTVCVIVISIHGHYGDK